MVNLKKNERGNIGLHTLDRFIGIPIVFLLGAFKKRQPFPKKINKIGILATAAIGDTILLSGSIKDLCLKYPDSEIIMFVGASNFAISKLLDIDVKITEIVINNPYRSMQVIRSFGKFDLFIDCGPWPRLNSILTFFARSKLKIGFRTKGQFRHYIYDKTVEHSNQIHEIKNIQSLFGLSNISTNSPPSLKVKIVKKYKNRVVLHMFPGGSNIDFRTWDRDKWKILIQWLHEKNMEIFLTGGPEDRLPLSTFGNEMADLDGVHHCAGKLSLSETLNLLLSCQIVISVNTGIMHLASALNCNLIALHGATDPKRWGPINSNSVVIQANPLNKKLLHLGFEKGVYNALMDVSTQDVINAARKYIQESPPGPE